MRKLSALVSLSFAAFGQTFESASVTLSGPTASSSHMVDNPDRFEFLYGNLRSLIALAYHVIPPRVIGPDWIGSEAIDVIATKPPNTTEEDQRLMLQALLAERFRLVVHRDSYDVTAYDLGVAKGGPKIKLANGQSKALVGKMKGPARSISGTLSMEDLAHALQRPLESPVTNATGLPSLFEILLEWSPEDAIAADLPEARFPPLAVALEQQLGLKLKTHKIKIETLVVDSGQKIPSGN
jgi:uncharacterized protein (TIGR03435 family)